MRNKLKAGITIPELIGIFALVGVLCAAIAPHLMEFREASRLSRLRFNLEKIRLRIDEYRQRTGHLPERLDELFLGDDEPIFDNPLSLAQPGSRNRVKIIDAHPPQPIHVTPSGLGGWLYNPVSGGIWADTASFLEE